MESESRLLLTQRPPYLRPIRPWATSMCTHRPSLMGAWCMARGDREAVGIRSRALPSLAQTPCRTASVLLISSILLRERKTRLHIRCLSAPSVRRNRSIVAIYDLHVLCSIAVGGEHNISLRGSNHEQCQCQSWKRASGERKTTRKASLQLVIAIVALPSQQYKEPRVNPTTPTTFKQIR